MKTRKFYAVEVIDLTCNNGKDSGIYGRNDYSWINESLNGGDNAAYNMTEDEALEVKADFERVIKEKNLEWATVDIDSLEIPYAETMQDVADYYNESDILGPELDTMIEDNGWVNDLDTESGICHNESDKVIVNDNGKAVVVRI